MSSARIGLRPASRRLAFDDNAHCAALFGDHHRHLAQLERRLGVRVDARGNEVFVQGESETDVDAAAKTLEALYATIESGELVTDAEVDAAARHAARGDRAAIGLRTDKKIVHPRSPTQSDYIRAIGAFELVFGLGPAGTGKTYLAIAAAVAALRERKVDRLILSRPAVEAGERLGFLPGEMRDKLDPYMRPLYDALQDTLPEGKLRSRLDDGRIEIAPLAFMRGRTLANAFVILDEGQNATPGQMKMFLTRLGEGSRMVVTGDPSQCDLPASQPSGLIEAVRRLRGVEGVGLIEFAKEDVVRHPLVAKIIEAYDKPEPISSGGGATAARERS